MFKLLLKEVELFGSMGLCLFFFLSLLLMPKRSKVSRIRFFLTLKSRGVSVLKLGLWLTSSSQGLQFSSMKISKPRISKHMLLFSVLGWQDLYTWFKIGYTDITVLTIISPTYPIRLAVFTPLCRSNSNTEESDRLWPNPSFCSLWL